MSLPRQYAQRLTRRFALVDTWAATFAQSDFDAWFAANPGKIRKDGSLYTIAGNAPGSNFLDVVVGDNGATALDHNSSLNHADRKTIKDFGKEIRIGNAAESDMLVFRLVQFSGPAASNGVPGDVSVFTAYVVVESNASDLISSNNGRYRIAVARV